MADTQHFCLRWNNYQSSLTSAFENLRDDEDFVDVTLACDGKSLKAHRVVLSACSPYFRELLKSTPCKHPVIVLQDVAFHDLHALVEFIYHGEVNVHQRNLTSFLKTAEVLRVSGLTQQPEDREEFPGPNQNLLRGGLHHGFSEKLDESLFTPPSPPPPTSTGATVNQLIRRASGLPPFINRRERHNSVDVQSDSAEQSQHSMPVKRARTSTHENNNHNSETTSLNQVNPTDFSTTPLSSKNMLNVKKEIDGSGDRDSSPSPTGPLPDGVKSEPVEGSGHGEAENSTDSIEASTEAGGSHQQSSTGDPDDHDSIQGHPSVAFLAPPESKLFGSVTPTGTSFSFSMAALAAADPSALSGLANQTLQGTPEGSTQSTSSQGGPSCQLPHAVPPPDGCGHRCDVCWKLLSTKLTLKRHKEQQHLQPLHKAVCSLCNKVFRTMNSLNNHRSIYHRKLKQCKNVFYNFANDGFHSSPTGS